MHNQGSIYTVIDQRLTNQTSVMLIVSTFGVPADSPRCHVSKINTHEQVDIQYPRVNSADWVLSVTKNEQKPWSNHIQVHCACFECVPLTKKHADAFLFKGLQ